MKNLFFKGLLFSLALFISTTCPYADIVVPKKLNVQGRVTNDSGQPITGKKCEIKLYIDDMNNAIDTKQADLDSEGLYNTNMDLSSFLNNHNFDTTYKFKVSVKPEGESLITSEESDLVAVPYSICSSTSNYSEKLKTDFILSNSNFSTDIYSNIMISPINIKDKGSYDNKYSIKVDSATYADTANNVSGSGIADKSITDAKMADKTLETRSIKDSAITTDKIADSAVTSAKLASDVKTDSVESGNSAALTSKGAYTNLVRRNSTTQATGGVRQGVYIDADGKVQVGTAVTDTYSSTGEAPASGKAIADALNSYVLKTTTINGSALDSDITLYGTSINMSNSDSTTLKSAIDGKADSSSLNSYVPKTTTINGSALESDITLYGTSIKMSNTDTTTLKSAIDGKVPTTRKVNGSALSSDITLYGTSINMSNSDSATLKSAIDGKVPTTRKVNGSALSSDITLYGTSIKMSSSDSTTLKSAIDGKADSSSLNSYVPKTTTINGSALESDITLYGTSIKMSNTDTTTLKSAIDGKVPTTRKVNGSALSSDITLYGTSINMSNSDSATLKSAIDGKVPTTRKVNGSALSSDITLYGTSIKMSSSDSTTLKSAIDGKADSSSLNSYVPKTTTINGSALESDITLYGTSIKMSNTDTTTLKSAIDGKVPTTRKVNGSALSSDITLYGTSINMSNSDSTTLKSAIDGKQDVLSGDLTGAPDKVWAKNTSGQGWVSMSNLKTAVNAADLAEIYRSKENLQPGDVVSIDTTRDDAIVKTKVAEDTLVAGVISTDPGLLLNSAEKGYKLALVGKVPTKVCNEGGEIKRGDLLVSASIAGYAKKAGDNPKAGTVIGKALENFSSKRGTILVLVNLQ